VLSEIIFRNDQFFADNTAKPVVTSQMIVLCPTAPLRFAVTPIAVARRWSVTYREELAWLGLD
jgi:hypothetical protein